jgi:hypothetical protein
LRAAPAVLPAAIRQRAPAGTFAAAVPSSGRRFQADQNGRRATAPWLTTKATVSGEQRRSSAEKRPFADARMRAVRFPAGGQLEFQTLSPIHGVTSLPVTWRL